MNLTTAAMITEILTRCNLTSTDRAQVLFWFQEAQNDLEKKRKDWRFCLDLANTLTTVADQFAYDLSADFSHFVAVYDVTNKQTLYPKPIDWVRRRDPDSTETGKPNWYIRLGPTGTSGVEAVGFNPIPNTSSETIGHDYYKKLPALVDSATYSLVPDHGLLMKIVEVRGRIHNEEKENSPVIQRLEAKIREAELDLIRYNTFDLDENKHMRQDDRMTLRNWG